MRTEQLSKNFQRWEVECQGHDCCGHSSPFDMRLTDLLQAIRDRVGAAVTITSGFRCRRHNANIPNAHPDSYHTYGMAADITTNAMDAAALYEIAQEVFDYFGYGFAILYSAQNFVHVDIRNA